MRLPQLLRITESRTTLNHLMGLTENRASRYRACRPSHAAESGLLALGAALFLSLPSDPAIAGNALAIRIVFPPGRGDAGYRGKWVEWTKKTCHWVLEIVKRNDDVSGFEVLPKRWIVERTFAWLGRSPRREGACREKGFGPVFRLESEHRS